MEEQAGSTWLQRGHQDGGVGTEHVTPRSPGREAGVTAVMTALERGLDFPRCSCASAAVPGP